LTCRWCTKIVRKKTDACFTIGISTPDARRPPSHPLRALHPQLRQAPRSCSPGARPRAAGQQRRLRRRPCRTLRWARALADARPALGLRCGEPGRALGPRPPHSARAPRRRLGAHRADPFCPTAISRPNTLGPRILVCGEQADLDSVNRHLSPSLSLSLSTIYNIIYYHRTTV